MAEWTIRQYEGRDFAALYKLDQACFPVGIAYSKWSLQYFLNLPAADCLVAEEGKAIVGFILAEKHPPLAHIITLDVAKEKRRGGLGSCLLAEMEKHFRFHEVKSVLLETAVDNESGIGSGNGMDIVRKQCCNDIIWGKWMARDEEAVGGEWLVASGG